MKKFLGIAVASLVFAVSGCAKKNKTDDPVATEAVKKTNGGVYLKPSSGADAKKAAPSKTAMKSSKVKATSKKKALKLWGLHAASDIGLAAESDVDDCSSASGFGALVCGSVAASQQFQAVIAGLFEEVITGDATADGDAWSWTKSFDSTSSDFVKSTFLTVYCPNNYEKFVTAAKVAVKIKLTPNDTTQNMDFIVSVGPTDATLTDSYMTGSWTDGATEGTGVGSFKLMEAAMGTVDDALIVASGTTGVAACGDGYTAVKAARAGSMTFAIDTVSVPSTFTNTFSDDYTDADSRGFSTKITSYDADSEFQVETKMKYDMTSASNAFADMFTPGTGSTKETIVITTGVTTLSTIQYKTKMVVSGGDRAVADEVELITCAKDDATTIFEGYETVSKPAATATEIAGTALQAEYCGSTDANLLKFCLTKSTTYCPSFTKLTSLN